MGLVEDTHWLNLSTKEWCFPLPLLEAYLCLSKLAIAIASAPATIPEPWSKIHQISMAPSSILMVVDDKINDLRH